MFNSLLDAADDPLPYSHDPEIPLTMIRRASHLVGKKPKEIVRILVDVIQFGSAELAHDARKRKKVITEEERGLCRDTRDEARAALLWGMAEGWWSSEMIYRAVKHKRRKGNKKR